jgi:hypothetical protein
VQAWLDMGDHLLRPEDEPQGIFDFGNDVRIGRIISQLLCRLDETSELEITEEQKIAIAQFLQNYDR